MATANDTSPSRRDVISRDFAAKPRIEGVSNATELNNDYEAKVDFQIQVHGATYKSNYKMSSHFGRTIGVLVCASTQLAAHAHLKLRPPAWRLRIKTEDDVDVEERVKARFAPQN